MAGMGGYSAEASPIISTESPTRIPAWATAPSGRFRGGKVSTAPKARRRKVIVRWTVSFTRYGVTFRYPVGIFGTMAGPLLTAPCSRRHSKVLRRRGTTPPFYAPPAHRGPAKSMGNLLSQTAGILLPRKFAGVRGHTIQLCE